MKKPKRSDDNRIIVKTESREEFFSRGRQRAKLLDAGKLPESERIISFESAEDLVKFLSVAKLTLLAAIRKKPDSISKLASKLQRSRAAIDKDIQLLESVGIVESEYVINPGHGRSRIIRAVDEKPVKLQVETVI